MPTSRGEFAQLLAPGLRQVIFDDLAAHPEEYSQLFNIYPSEKAYEEDQLVAGLGSVPVKPEGQGERVVKGLWENFFFRTGELPARAGSELTAIFHRQLNRLGRCELVPLAQAQAVVEGVDPHIFRQDPIGTAVQIGREIGVYAVVIGVVYRFEQRRGSALGVESPASAAFDALLIDGPIVYNYIRIDTYIKTRLNRTYRCTRGFPKTTGSSCHA